jgi:hypothetical protein
MWRIFFFLGYFAFFRCNLLVNFQICFCAEVGSVHAFALIFLGEVVACMVGMCSCSFVYSQQERKPVYGEVLLYHDV